MKKQIKNIIPKTQFFYWRRKKAICTIYKKNGEGKIIINKKDINIYFSHKTCINLIKENFEDKLKELNLYIKVSGGGYMSQTLAIRNGIAKLLCTIYSDLVYSFKQMGFLSFDARKKERKKYGLKKARKAPQFTKR